MAIQKNVVAISSPSDPHLEFVERHLPRPFILLDQLGVADGQSLTFDLSSSNEIRVFLDKHRLQNVSGVWYRRPGEIRPENLPVEKHLQKYSAASLKEFGLLMRSLFPESTWVSDVYAIRRAENKLLQLSLARKLGFNVPDTLVTSDPAAARKFIDARKTVITKPIQVEFFEQDGEMYNFFAKRVDSSVDLSGLHLAPSIFQQAIDVDMDLRVTVVGDDVFAASIHDHAYGSDSGVRDWRLAQYGGDLDIEAYELPAEVADKCRSLVRDLGLKFGAIDMILDRAGKYWFLENNPNGQWAFIEHETKQPIGKALADLLLS